MSVNDDWQREMHRLLEIFEKESISSLRKINRYFVALGRPFDESFRQYFLKNSTVRLDTSFDTVLFERFGENSTNRQATPNFYTPNHDDEVDGNTNYSYIAEDNVGTLNTSRDGVLSELKIDNNSDAPIEIVDSDDEDDGKQRGTNASDDSNGDQMELNTLQEPSNDDDEEPNDEQNDTNSNSDKEVDDVECKPKLENEMETEEMDLAFVAFDPNEENENERLTIENEANVDAGSMIDQNQPSSSSSSSSSALKPVKRSDGKRFKCNDCAYTSQYKQHLQYHQLIHKGIKPFKCDRCDYAARLKSSLKTHQRTHDRQKLLGVVKDPKDGLFKCTYCDQRFTKWEGFTLHLKKSHKNNQRLFNCKRCMRRFTQKLEKDRHEVYCQRRLYECCLCKLYVTKRVSQLEQHMRTHSSARPFQCAICNKSFRQKSALKRHLNSIHSRL